MEDRVVRYWAGDYWFLDNSYSTPVVHEAIVYPSVTHAMLGAQADNIDLKIRISHSGLEGLMALVKEFETPPQEFKAPEIMRKLLNYKFGYAEGMLHEMLPPQAEMAQKLIATGSKVLVYGNKNCSTFWGDCDCQVHFSEKGKNVLGGLLMAIRERLTEYVTRNVDLNQTCTCEKPSEAFFMYCFHGKLWLKPFCHECQAKVGVFVAKNAIGSVRRFEKEWAREKKEVNKIHISPRRGIWSPVRPDVFGTGGRSGWHDEADWAHRWAMGSNINTVEVEVEETKPLPQNITFYLSGRIS